MINKTNYLYCCHLITIFLDRISNNKFYCQQVLLFPREGLQDEFLLLHKRNRFPSGEKERKDEVN